MALPPAKERMAGRTGIIKPPMDKRRRARPVPGVRSPGAAGYGPELPPWLARLLDSFPQLQRRPHSMLAHFPIVFMLSTTFFTILYLCTGDKSFDDTAFYCLGGGLLTMPPTVATGLFTHWLNFSGRLHETVNIEKALSYAVITIGAAAFVWRWLNPRVLEDLGWVNLIYLFLVLSLGPLVTANGYYGGMATFPLEEELPPPEAKPAAG
jgi:uncharacterized membrane protein